MGVVWITISSSGLQLEIVLILYQDSMTTREYDSYTSYKLASGEVRRYPVKRRYVSVRTYTIPDDKRAEIIKLHELGVPSTRIARSVELTVKRVRHVIKKAKVQAVIQSGLDDAIEAKKED